MPLLKPPEQQIATRKFFVRIEEPLALTMERYTEFLGTDNLDHVVGQALQFNFKRDTQVQVLAGTEPGNNTEASPHEDQLKENCQ
jgi:hypothetical protein